MLAPRYFSQQYQDWNDKWGAPFGYPNARRINRIGIIPLSQKYRLAGYFAFQANNTTRYFEYPWVYDQIDHTAGRAIIDVGAGVTGLQFVLAKMGHKVYCVDPGLADRASYTWGSLPVTHEALNTAFHTDVTAYATTVEETSFSPDSFDYVTCVSTIEHISQESAESMVQFLKPGGKMILTIDLSLDIIPWTDQPSNKWGSNIDVKRLVDAADQMMLTVGNPAELYGFEEFDPQDILRNLSNFYVGEYPCMAQCLVLTKRQKGPNAG
jgi:2-polyprenyl-3-methyl-5-hydroxy-6-metoxy-1,4-benzoquinol methylase